MFHTVWCFFILFLLLINIFYMPLDLTFELKSTGFTNLIMNVVPTIAFLIEIILTFNTGMPSKWFLTPFPLSAELSVCMGTLRSLI